MERAAVISINGRNVHSSKNSHQIWGKRLVKSKAAKADEPIFAAQLAEQLPTWQAMTRGAAYPLVVIFRLRRATLAEFDYNNIIQGILDAMQKAGYLHKDSMKHVIPVPAEWILDRKNPGCDIWLGSFGDYLKLTETR